MRISFYGMDAPVEVCQKGMTVLRVLNESLFARICESLISGKGEEAREPYSIWGCDGAEVSPSNALLVVANPFDLPWKQRTAVGRLYSILGEELRADEDLGREMQDVLLELESSIRKLGFQLNGDYRFGVEWSLESHLRAFSYEVDIPDSASLLDNLISFVDFGADIKTDKVIVFVNLKTFLTKNELLELNDRFFFHGMGALLLENHESVLHEGIEQEYVVDRDFVEYVVKSESECLSFSQEGFCSNGFGAVAF